MTSASDIRAGGAYVELSVKDDALRAGMANAQRRLTQFANSFQTLGSALTFNGLAGTIQGWVESFAHSGEEMYKLSQRTGVSVEQLDELKKAARESNLEFDSVSTGIRRFSRFLGELRTSGQNTNPTLERLQLTIADLNGLSFADQFQLVGERIDAIGDASQRTSLAMAMMGREGDSLLPMFRDLAGARGRARSGGVMSSEEAARAFELADAFENFGRAKSGFFKTLGATLSPAFGPVLNALTNGQKSLKGWVKDNESLVQVVGWSVAGLATLAAGLATVGTVAQTTGFVLGGLKLAAVAFGGIFGAAFGLLTSPITIVIGLIAGLGYLIATQTDIGRNAVSRLSTVWGNLAETMSAAWSGVVDALRSGDLALAAQIAFTGVRVAWHEMIQDMMRSWDGFRMLVGGWEALQNHFAFIGASVGGIATGNGLDWTRELIAEQRRQANLTASGFGTPLNDARGDLDRLMAEATRRRAETDAALRNRFRVDSETVSSAIGTGARGTFSGSSAFGLIGANNPVVVQLQTLNSAQREANARLRQIAEQQAVFQ